MDAKENSEEWYRGTRTYENDPARLNNLNIDLFGISEFLSEGDFDRIYLFGVGGNRLRTLPLRIDYGEGRSRDLPLRDGGRLHFANRDFGRGWRTEHPVGNLLRMIRAVSVHRSSKGRPLLDGPSFLYGLRPRRRGGADQRRS